MSAFDFFDDIQCINHLAHNERWTTMERRFARLGIGTRVRRFPAQRSPSDARIGRALSHRRIVQDAAERGLRSVLVIEDETLFLDRTDLLLTAAVTELRGLDWKLLYLGTPRGSLDLCAEPGCAHLRRAGRQTTAHAVAYNGVGFPGLLAAMPMSFGAMRDHLGEDGSIDTILSAFAPALVVHPSVATVPARLPFQEPADQERFVP